MTKLLQLQITNTLLVIELNKTAAHNDIIKFQNTISPFCQQNPVPLISSCTNFHIVKLLFQNTSISFKFTNVLLRVQSIYKYARINKTNQVTFLKIFCSTHRSFRLHSSPIYILDWKYLREG